MKPLLLIDYYRTLCHDKFWRSLGAELRDAVEHHVFGKNSDLVWDWMRGEHSSESINRFVADHFQIDYGKLWDVFVADCKNMSISKEDLAAIKELRKKFKTILITDNMDSFKRFTIPSLGLTDYFDDIVDSYSEKLLKGREMFERVLQKHEGDVARCVLIDDSKVHCEMFRDMGGKALPASKERPLGYWLRNL